MHDDHEPERTGAPGRALRATIERELGQNRVSTARNEPPAISDHTLLQRIGGGAYGDVWLARTALGSLRAVKIVYRACYDDERPYQREFNGILKYEPVSRTHPGLMQVLHVGRDDSGGFFYYVIELADEVSANFPTLDPGTDRRSGGPEQKVPPFRPRTLRSDLGKGLRLAPHEAARVVLKLADALSHLHKLGLVHRDIKPANVIFVGGEPKLADIGLVTSVGDSRSFVGTEGFIPPEGPGTAQADLYSLGKLLYELATGRDRLEFPQLPLGVRESPEGEALLDLNEVMTRACEPEPKDRYATVDQLRADLQAFLAGRSLRDARKVERHLAWLKALLTATVLLLAVGGVVVWIAKTNERQALQRARTEASLRARAETAERAFEQELYAALVGQAQATMGSHEVGQRVRTLDALRRAAAITNSTELRPLAMAALALPDLRLKREIELGGEYKLAELDPTFNRVALGKGAGPIEVRAVPDLRLLATLPPSSDWPAFIANWNSDGRFLGVKRNRSLAGDQSDLEVWRARDFQRILLVPKAAFGVFCFDPRWPRLLGSCGGGTVAVWNLEDGRQLTKLPLDSNPNCLAISPDGLRFAAACKTKTGWSLSVYRMEDGARLTSCFCSNVVSSLDWHPGGRWIAAADDSGAVFLLQSQTGARRSLGRHKVQAVLTRFSPDGGYLVSGGWERELIFWDLSKMERALTLRLGSFSARFSADGRECALAGTSGVQSYLQINSFELPACDRELAEELGGRVHFAAFSPDGEWFAAAGLQRLGVWDLTQPGPGTLADAGADSRLYFAANDQLFASHENTAFRWRPGRGVQAGTAPVLESLPLAAPNKLTSLCAVSNRIVWTTSGGSRVSGLELAEASDGNWTATTPGINGASPDGRWLAVYQPFTSRLYVYRLPGLELACTITNTENIGTFAFSPSGGQLAVMSSQRVQLWRTSDWRHLCEVDHCHDVLFCPQEPLAWLTRDYSEAGLYDLRTMALLAPLPTGWLPLALSQDGRHLAVSIDAQRVQVWDLERLREEIRALGLDWPGGVR